MPKYKSDIARAFQTFQGQRGRGPRALLVAVMGAAAVDLANGDAGAARYFLSQDYKKHLELVGLPADFLPAGVTTVELVELVEGQRRKMSQNITLGVGGTYGASRL